MKIYDAKDIRNVVLAGHGGVGKTSIVEAIAYNTKTTDRFGKVLDGNTVSDFEPEEIKRQISLSLSLVPIEHKGIKINLLDSPGYFDFVGEVKAAMRVADSAIIVVDVVSGSQAGTEKTFQYAEENNLPTAFIVNKIDRENSNVQECTEKLKNQYGKKCARVQIPYFKDRIYEGMVDIIHRKYFSKDGKEGELPEELSEKALKTYVKLLETAIEVDDEILEKYLGGAEISHAEFLKCFKKAINRRIVYPILYSAALLNEGADSILDFIFTYMPSPQDRGDVTAIKEDKSETTFKVDKNGPLCALVFKTMTDPYVGRISLVKVFSGTLKSDTKIYNSTSDENEKVGNLASFIGKKEVKLDCIQAGDIGALTKLSFTKTGDTLSDTDNKLDVDWIALPTPNAKMSLKAEKKSDEDKLGSVLPKIKEDDVSIVIERNPDTGETIVCGMGETHLNVAMEKAKRKFGVSFVLREPKVSYKETIRKTVKVEGKHRKQSGGHGQFGHCWLEVGPSDKGEAYQFENKIFGGSIPKQYIPAVEKGIHESMKSGNLAGYPIVNLKITIYDGSYHPVDSSEQAFKMAGAIALRKALDAGGTVLLEPIMRLAIHIPEEYMGAIIDDMNTKRGRIMSMNVDKIKGWQIIDAQAPLNELSRFITDVNSISGARGFYEMKFSHYEEAPPKVVKKVVEQSKKDAEEAI